MGSSVYHRTPYTYRVPQESWWEFMILNAAYTLGIQMLAYRCLRNPAFFIKAATETVEEGKKQKWWRTILFWSMLLRCWRRMDFTEFTLHQALTWTNSKVSDHTRDYMFLSEEFDFYNSGGRRVFLSALAFVHISSLYINTYVYSFIEVHTQSYNNIDCLKTSTLPELCPPWSLNKAFFLMFSLPFYYPV